MTGENIKILNEFDVDHIPDLDVAVLGALELFMEKPVPNIEFGKYKHPLIVGSGNAEAAGRIIFKSADAVFASESSCDEKLRYVPDIDRVILISAFAGKHAPVIADVAKKYDKKVTLFTNNPDSLAKKKLDIAGDDEEYVFPRNREPYTYNTSTYMGMFLSSTGEDPKEIHAFLEERIVPMDFSRLKDYEKFFFIIPTEFSEMPRMLYVKFFELFGRRIARDIATFDFMSHATTVVPSRELFVSFGKENEIWGPPEHRLHVPLPPKAGYAAMMAVSYYMIGQIQKRHPPYFKEHIAAYVKDSSKIFGHEISAIVE